MKGNDDYWFRKRNILMICDSETTVCGDRGVRGRGDVGRKERGGGR